MEKIINNHGLQHLAEIIFLNLNSADRSETMSIDQPICKSNLGQSIVLDKEIDSKWTLKGEPKRLVRSHSIGDEF